jgi:hypothetical protein
VGASLAVVEIMRGLAVMCAVGMACLGALWLESGGASTASPEAVTSGGGYRANARRVVSADERLDAIARAQVWHEPDGQLPAAAIIETLSCRFVVKRQGGTTPKFNCVLDGGDDVRIKYGGGAEIPAEAAATRLLRALGFAADEMTLVHHLRCYGCPLEPYAAMKVVQILHANAAYERAVDYEGFRDFEWVALERKFDAWPIESANQEGWAFPELDRVDHARGGAAPEQIDALRLVSVFLAHWDNKSENQRLVCVSADWRPDTRCDAPVMLLQDLGATFGPKKVNFRRWRASTIWADRAGCVITMRHLPYSGATFADVRVGEPGRQLASRLLGRLRDDEIADLFRSARFDQPRGLFNEVKPVAAWVEAFKARVRRISEGPPCPPA